MTVELDEVYDFLAANEPFASLSTDQLNDLPSKMDMVYVRRGEVVVPLNAPNEYLHLIRSGAVDIVDDAGVLLDRRDAGSAFGYSTLKGENKSRYNMVAVEDTLLLRLPREAFFEVASKNPELDRFFSSQSARLRNATEELRQNTSGEVLRTRLAEFKIPNPATIEPTKTIQQAAQLMQERNVSSLLISPDGSLHGIITDRDLRKKVVAVNYDVTKPVTDIMTANPRSADSETLAFEAMLIMAELGIHHLPVVDDGQVTGIIASADIMRLLRHDPIYLTADLSKRSTPEEMRSVYASASDVAVRFIERGASAEEVTGLLTVAADALARRLLVLAEEKFGAPPVRYCFVVVGSQGRRGMGLASDQDNCLVLSNDYNEAEHGQYFKDLSEYVCKGLAEAGQALCPGDMMAMNPAWRMTVDTWISTFRQWITAPEPDALLHAQTFFDFRGIYGDISMAEEVHRAAVEMSQGASRMHAHLAALAARREPPLGFFRGLVVDRGGEYANTLDVKKGGIAAVVQMARLYSLSSGIDAVGTNQRLELSAGQGAVSEKGALDLLDSYEFLFTMSLRWQADQIRAGEQPSYHVDPKSLGKMDREHLRDAFQIIKNMQSALTTKYPVRNI